MIRSTHRTESDAQPPPSAGEASASGAPAGPIASGHICPFCGLAREITAEFDPASPCPRCTLADTPSTRNATKLRVGPWHVRQVRNPWAPGMRFETLMALIKRGQVTRDSIVRGPTTHQLWKRASEIKGLSREFGLCHSCAGVLDPQAHVCPHCNRLQEPPANPDALMEVREPATPHPAPASGPAAAPVAGVPRSAMPDAPSPAAPTPDASDEPASIDMSPSTPAMSTSSVDDLANLLAVTEEPVAAPPAERGRASREPMQREQAPREQSSREQASPEQTQRDQTQREQASPKPSSREPGSREAVSPVPSREPGRRPDRPAKPERGTSSSKRTDETNPQGREELELEPLPEEHDRPSRQDRPMAIRPVTPGADDALLTPQELAAAFQLDFKPQSAARGRVGSKLPALLLLLLLLGGGTAALFYLRPDLREQASAWTGRVIASVKQFVAARSAPAAGVGSSRAARPASDRSPATAPIVGMPVKPRPAVVAPPAVAEPPVAVTPVAPTPPGPAEVVVGSPNPRAGAVQGGSESGPKVLETPTPAKATPPETPVRSASQADRQPQSVAAAPTTRPTETPTTDATIAATAGQKLQGSAAAPPSGAAPTPPPAKAAVTAPIAQAPIAPAPIPPAPIPPTSPASPAASATTRRTLDAGQAVIEARRLFGRALDAEENQDYVEAIRCYEEIKRLPVDARAMGVDVRLERARKLIQ